MVSYISNEYSRVNLRNKNRLTSNSIEKDVNIFHSFQNEKLNYKFDERKVLYDENYKTPREIYDETQCRQGIIGKGINQLKNTFVIFSILGMKGSNEVEEILENYENGNLKEFEAFDAVENYKQSQKFLTNLVLNMIMLVTFISVFLITKLFGTETSGALTLSCMLSGAIRFGLEKLEYCTCKKISNPVLSAFTT